jgi:hypothetical protein
MLGLPSGVSLVESTPHEAPVATDALMRFVCLAVASSTYLTNPDCGQSIHNDGQARNIPFVGSAVSKKSNAP